MLVLSQCSACLGLTYLWASLGLTVLTAAAVLLLPLQRPQILISGLLNSSMAWGCFLLEGSYWQPPRIIGEGFGVEDFLTAFAAGGLSWVFVSRAGSWRNAAISASFDFFLPRFLGFIAVGFALILGLVRSGVDPMSAYLVTLLACLCAVVVHRRDVAVLIPLGALTFGVFWYLVALATFSVAPGFYSHWNQSSVWAVRIMGVPLGELAWGFVFGAGWPPFVAFMLATSPGGETR